MAEWSCEYCGYVYLTQEGEPPDVAPGTEFEAISDDWECPDCGAGKEAFDQID